MRDSGAFIVNTMHGSDGDGGGCGGLNPVWSKIFLGCDGQEEDFTLLAQGWIFSKGFPAKTPPLNCLFISNRRPIFTTPALMT